MTPEKAIAMLDRQMLAHGQAIAFKRGATEQAAVGFVRGYKAEQLVGLITQQDREVVVSPSSLGSFAPRENDEFAVTASVTLGTVMAAEPVHIGTTLVRWNIRVRLT